jgi:hypothetical protein
MALQDLDPREWFGKVITDSLTDMAADYQRAADKLRSLADQVPDIGQPRGLNTLTATDLLHEALGYPARFAPHPGRLIRAVAEYERNVGVSRG